MSRPIIQNSPRPLTMVETVNQIEHENNTIVSTCFGNVYLKRLFLPFIGLGFLFFVDETHTFIYIPIIILFISFIIFWNYPYIVIFTNSKPLYYEDLFVDTSSVKTIEVDIQIRNRFEKYFEWSLIITNSLFAAFLSDYWLYQSTSKETVMEIIGITGGMLKIFQSINYFTGNIILYITHYYITSEVEKNKLEFMGNASNLELMIVDNNINHNDNVIIINTGGSDGEHPRTDVILSLPHESKICPTIQSIVTDIIFDVVDDETREIIKDLSNLTSGDNICEVYPEIKAESTVSIELSTFNSADA